MHKITDQITQAQIVASFKILRPAEKLRDRNDIYIPTERHEDFDSRKIVFEYSLLMAFPCEDFDW